MTPTVLMVDDDHGIREVARLALERVGGWRVRTAADAEEAVASATAEAPDVVLLDVMMPGTDGPSTLARLRALPAMRDVPVVFLTAKLQPEEVTRLAALDVAGVLGKPFDAMTLAADVRRTVGWDGPPSVAGAS
jgi:CheY-like chemotaxis protein